ncbi:MAG: DUF535 family protein [Nitrosomonadales bacterium]|nr:DUF535 family protein [Nitrosomonadales bacterium]
MSIGFIETLVRVHHLGKLMHPTVNLNGIKHRVVLMIRTVAFFPAIRKWYEISDNPLLIRALERFPQTSGAMYWPYINHTWPMERRLATIDQHFRMLGGRAAVIALATFEEVELARMDEEYKGLRLVLDKAIWFLREGEIVLNLFINDQRFYSIALTLGLESGQPVVLVGALQGSNSEVAQEVYRDITHTLHGMRPRDLLMVALKLFCLELGFPRIWAVSSDNRQHNSPYFGNSHKEKVLVAYNEVWQEHGGTEVDSGFFEIPAVVKYKDMSEIPSRKRATYRRRYEMLDKLAADIRASCSRYAERASN